MKELKHLINDLRTTDYTISDNILRQILRHDLEAVPYLVVMLKDTMDNFEQYDEDAYYMEQYKKEEFQWFTAYHALLLLAELEAEEAFPIVLEFYRQGRYFLDFWLRDIWPAYATYALSRIGHNHIDDLMEVLDDEEEDLLTRRMISGAFSKMVVLYPEKRQDVLGCYRALLRSDHSTEFITNVIMDILDCNGHELEADIHAAYDQKKVEEDFFPRDEVVFTAKDAVNPGWDIFTIYKHIREELRE